MNPEKFAFAVGVVVLAGGWLGLMLHRLLPEKHVTGGKDMIGARRRGWRRAIWAAVSASTLSLLSGSRSKTW